MEEEKIANQKGLFCIDNEERWNPLEKVATMIQMNLHYNKRFKQRHIEENFGPSAIELSPDKDPRIKYIMKCSENLDRVLPILDKVYMKTICL